MKPYSTRKFSSQLFVKNQKYSGRCSVTEKHIIEATKLLTSYLKCLYKQNPDPEIFSRKASMIIDNNDDAEDKIIALFPENDNSNKSLLKKMLKLSRLKQRDRVTYEKCFGKFFQKNIEGDEREKFMKYYMMVVSTIIEMHIIHDIVIETSLYLRSIEKENRAPILSAENLGDVGLYKHNKLPRVVEEPPLSLGSDCIVDQDPDRVLSELSS